MLQHHHVRWSVAASVICAVFFSTLTCAALSCHATAPRRRFMPETTKKSYACETEGTQWQDTITDVWAQCNTDVKKCDVGLSLG